MTTLTAPAEFPLPSARRSKLAWAAADSLAVAQRNIIGMTRRPQLLAFATIQPVLFVLLFRYVFGGSIHIPGVSYANYLMAGIFVQTVMFGAQSTAVGKRKPAPHKGAPEPVDLRIPFEVQAANRQSAYSAPALHLPRLTRTGARAAARFPHCML
jgi:hypothetical protein